MSEEIPPIVFDSVHYHDELGEHRLTSEQKIRVVSWNVLADSCRKYHPNADLDKYQRDAHALLERVLNDFLSKQVDIICLQEVDNGVVSQVLAPSYFGRTTPNRLSCQIWARRGLWVPVGEARVVKMNDLATNGLPKKKYWRQKPKTKFQERFLTDNFGIIAKFKHNASGRKICVSNTLLYGDSKYDNIKLCQVDYIARNIRSYLTGSDRDIPILFCGDLNSLPGTAVHKYLTKRGNTVPDFSLDRLRRDCQPGDMVLSSFAVSLFGTQSPFRFRNSYNETAKYFTNVTSKFTGFLDYVLFQPEKLQQIGRLYLPDSSESFKATYHSSCLPCQLWPSDHLPVGADLAFKETTTKHRSWTGHGHYLVTAYNCGQNGLKSYLHAKYDQATSFDQWCEDIEEC